MLATLLHLDGHKRYRCCFQLHAEPEHSPPSTMVIREDLEVWCVLLAGTDMAPCDSPPRRVVKRGD